MVRKRFAAAAAAALSVSLLAACAARGSAAPAGASARFPAPTEDPSPAAKGMQVAVLAGGCFWGMEAVFERLKGVTDVISGYSGGTANTAQYEMVGTGTTGHAESIQVTYDPSVISYGTLLKVFFSVAHDPTQLNYQGPDHGTQYRSAIFFANDSQRSVAQAYIAALTTAHVYKAPIVTGVAPLRAFYPAEEYHQDFMDRNPTWPYIVAWDKPRVQELERMWPELLSGKYPLTK